MWNIKEKNVRKDISSLGNRNFWLSSAPVFLACAPSELSSFRSLPWPLTSSSHLPCASLFLPNRPGCVLPVPRCNRALLTFSFLNSWIITLFCLSLFLLWSFWTYILCDIQVVSITECHLLVFPQYDMVNKGVKTMRNHGLVSGISLKKLCPKQLNKNQWSFIKCYSSSIFSKFFCLDSSIFYLC